MEDAGATRRGCWGALGVLGAGGVVCSGSADRRDQGQVNSLVHGGDPLEPTKEKHLVYRLLADRGKPCQADSKRGAAVFPESQPRYVTRRRGAQENCSSVLSVQFSSAAQSCPTLRDPMSRSTPGIPVHHQLPELTQTRSPAALGGAQRRESSGAGEGKLSGQIGSPYVGSFYNRGGVTPPPALGCAASQAPPHPCRLKLGRSPEADGMFGSLACV